MAQNASTYYTTMSYGQYIFIQSLYIPIGIFGIFGNTLVLTAYFKCKQLRKLDCAYLIAALSTCDLISGYGNLVTGASRLEIPLFNNYDFTRFYCIITAVLLLIGLEMGDAMIISIAIDRLIAVAKPLKYRAMDHRFYSIVSFSIAIVYGFVRMLIQSFVGVDFNTTPSRCVWGNSIHPISTKIALIVDAISGVTITVIYVVVIYKQGKWSRKITQRINQHTVGHSTLPTPQEKQAKMTKLLTVLVGVYCLLVAVPATVLFLAITFQISPNFTNTYLPSVVNILMSLNSSVNLLVYVHSSSVLRPFILRMLNFNKQNIDSITN